MNDWKGNEITVGMIVSKIRYKNWYEGGKISLGFMSSDGIEFIGKTVYQEDNYFWDVVETARITEPSNTFTMMFDPNAIGSVPINHIGGFQLHCNAFEIICIQGISDNMDEFFKSLISVN
jgi:hypothetical protein